MEFGVEAYYFVLRDIQVAFEVETYNVNVDVDECLLSLEMMKLIESALVRVEILSKRCPPCGDSCGKI